MFRRRNFADDVDAPERRGVDLHWLIAAPAALLRGIGWAAVLAWQGTARRIAGSSRRSLGHLVAGLPAVLAGVGLVAFLVIARQQRGGLRATYAAAADAADMAGDADAAVLHRRRLGQLGAGDAEARFRLAGALSKAGRDGESQDLLAGLLARDGSPGYAPAHLLLADRMLDFPAANELAGDEPAGEEPDADNPADERERAVRRLAARRHLAAARRAAPEDLGVALQIANLSLRAEDAKTAAAMWEEVAPTVPSVWPNLVRVYAALGRVADATRAAERAVPVLRGTLKRDPLDLESRVQLADALARTGDDRDAEAVLTDGLALHPGAAIPQRLAGLHISQYDRATALSLPPAERLALLGRAIRRDPRSGAALVRLIQFSGAAGRTGTDSAAKSAEQARDLLERVLATGEVPALAHFELGMNSLAAEDREDAMFHLERAHALAPSLAAAANNLAFLYLTATPPAPERALGLADAAVAAAPTNAQLHETRGQILAALSRPADALAAFERAMALGLKDEPPVRSAVADLYDTLGQPALAARFRIPADAGPVAADGAEDGADAGETGDEK